MKDRLSASDWTAVVLNATAASVLLLLGRLLQLIAVLVVLVALWPTVSAFVGWLKTGIYLSPTPLNLAMGASRAVITATDWVVVRDVMLWLAGAHILVSAIPVALVVILGATLLLGLAQARSAAARDTLSRSLRDEYLAGQLAARYGRWFVFGVVLAAAAAGILFGWYSTHG